MNENILIVITYTH